MEDGGVKRGKRVMRKPQKIPSQRTRNQFKRRLDEWKQHMKALSYVKDFAGLKAYADKDPLEVYRTEGLALFDSMQKAFEQNTAFSFTQYDPKAAQK